MRYDLSPLCIWTAPPRAQTATLLGPDLKQTLLFKKQNADRSEDRLPLHSRRGGTVSARGDYATYHTITTAARNTHSHVQTSTVFLPFLLHFLHSWSLSSLLIFINSALMEIWIWQTGSSIPHVSTLDTERNVSAVHILALALFYFIIIIFNPRWITLTRSMQNCFLSIYLYIFEQVCNYGLDYWSAKKDISKRNDGLTGQSSFAVAENSVIVPISCRFVN